MHRVRAPIKTGSEQDEGTMEARLQSIDSNRVKYTERQDSIRLSAAAVQPAQQMICKRVTVVVAQPFAKATCQNAGELPTDLFAISRSYCGRLPECCVCRLGLSVRRQLEDNVNSRRTA